MERKNVFPIADKNLHFPHIFLLAASAGSGKTYNLSNRYIQFLLSPVIKKNALSSILAITFTENATKEMRSRIISFLKEIYFNAEKRKEIMGIVSLNEEDLIRVADETLGFIFSSYADFNVGTIDSFILKILSVSIDELGIPADYEVVFDNRLLIEKALADFMASFDIENGRKMIDDFLNAINNSSEDKFLFNPMGQIKEKFSQFMEKENKYLLDIKTVSVDLKSHKELREKIIKKIFEMYEKNKKLNPFLLSKASEAIKKKDGFMLMEIYNINGGLYLSNRIEVKQEIKNGQLGDCIREINSLFKKYYTNESLLFYNPFADFYIKFKENFYRRRRKDKTVSLSQITADISKYIKRQLVPEIYIKLAAKLNHFLIDEFQDTSLAQWNIIRPLAEDSLAGYGSLFLIGDIKQAIYMFRNADYKIMGNFLNGEATKHINTDSLKRKVECFQLDHNYRSAPTIVSYINSFFSSDNFKDYLNSAIGGDHTGLLNSKQAVVKGIDKKGYVRNVIIESSDRKDRDSFKEEFIKIAKDIVSRFDLEKIAVLVKKNDEVETVVSWLSEVGINAASFSSLDIRKRKVIAELQALLAFLDMPSDNFSFATFILGDIFARSAGKDLKGSVNGFLFECAGCKDLLYVSFREKFPDIWDKFFDELFSKSGYLTCYELINLSMAKFSVYSNFKEESAFLIKLLDVSYLLSFSGNSSVAALLEEIKNKNSADENFSVNMPEFVPAVRVMTFHKAKGLGFDAVINIFDFNSWRAVGGEKIYYIPSKESLELRKITEKMAKLLPDLRKIKENEKKEEEIQDLNTLYVALTRARFELVNIVKKPPKSQKILSIFEDNFEFGKKENFASVDKKDAEYLDISCPKSERIYNFIRNGESDNVETIRGNIYHKVLSFIKSTSDAKEENISLLVDKACLFYNLYWKEEKKEVVEKIIKTVNSLSEYFIEKTGRLIRNEAEFIGENGKIFRIDRLVEDKEQAFIIDYKTGIRGNYSAQMENYIITVSQALGKPAKGFFYYIDSGEIVP